MIASPADPPSAFPADGSAQQIPYQVMHVQPDGYVHAGALTELAEAVYFGIRRMGLQVHYGESAGPGARPIVIGAHLLEPDAMLRLPGDAIIYNTEQILPGSPWLSTPYLECLRSHSVWDYSRANTRRLADFGVGTVSYVPVGYVPELSRIAPAVEDVDVLFYGSINARRQAVLDELARRGLRVAKLFGIYGEERDHAIARAKVVLSIHFYESKVFEIVRAAYLFTNFKAVVAECSADTDIEPDIRGAIRAAPYDELADACVALVRDDAARQQLALRGHEIFSARPAESILSAALGAAQAPKPAAATCPPTLHLGSGKDFRRECLNVDINDAWGPDAVVDISAPGLIGTRIETERFGPVLFREGCFDLIVANDVLEHIPDLVSAMTNCLRLLRPGGRFMISVPYDLSLGAWQDPTHVRAFNDNSWLYYTDWHWYLGWVDMRFDAVSIEYQPSSFGADLIKAGKNREEILRTPRAVDNMRVLLRKRYLNRSERQGARAMQPGPARGRGSALAANR